MESYGIYSILPVVVTLIISFYKKNVFLALLGGIATGSLLITTQTNDLFVGFNALTSVFSDSSTTKVTFFIFLTGALTHVTAASGGVEGVVHLMTEKTKTVKSKRAAQLLAQITGLILFVDATSSIVVSSLIGKPFFDKFKIPREKLALIANSTGSPIAWLIPFGGAGALTAAAINGTKIMPQDGFTYVLEGVGFQFYSIILLIMILVTILLNLEFGAMKRVSSTYMATNEVTFETELEAGKSPRARNMIVPLATLLSLIFVLLYITGAGNLLRGDGSTAVFISGCLTLVFTGIYYMYQKITTLDQYIQWCFTGMKHLFEIVVILILAFTFSNILTQLQTATYLSTLASNVSASIIPVATLLLAAITAFSTGSSGGTVSILVPLLVPLALNLGVSVPLTIGALISGAVFGDQSSPISDSVILTSTMTDVKIMDHVKTQLPYTLFALVSSAILFFIAGFII